MKKLLTILGVTIASICVLIIVVLFFFLGFVVKTGIETIGPSITETPVSVDNVSVSPLSGNGSISNLVVGNPEDFNADYIFKLGSISFAVDIASLLSDTVIIKDISVLAPEIMYEQGLTSGSNLSALLDNISKALPTSAKEQTEGEKSAGKKIQIDHLLIEEGLVHLSAVFLQGKALPVPLPKVELFDLGKDSDEASIQAIIQEIMIALTESIQEVLIQANPMFREGADRLKDSTGELKGALDGTQKALEESGEKIFDTFKNFFGPKEEG